LGGKRWKRREIAGNRQFNSSLDLSNYSASRLLIRPKINLGCWRKAGILNDTVNIWINGNACLGSGWTADLLLEMMKGGELS
jgi:hypothetical protein